MKLENLGELNKTFISKTPSYSVKYLKSSLHIYKSYLRLTPESVSLQVLLAFAFMETKANVVLHYQLTLNTSEFSEDVNRWLQLCKYKARF